MKEHRLSVKVYLEDTDAFGIVYHANYLKYCERARTDLLAECGYSLAEMQKVGSLFVVFDMHLRFRQPARLHDELEVRSGAERGSDYRVTFSQEVFRRGGTKPIFIAEATVVTIDNEGLLCPLPDGLLA
jgi:acyl-CoA thioester hydrolase